MRNKEILIKEHPFYNCQSGEVISKKNVLAIIEQEGEPYFSSVVVDGKIFHNDRLSDDFLEELKEILYKLGVGRIDLEGFVI